MSNGSDSTHRLPVNGFNLSSRSASHIPSQMFSPVSSSSRFTRGLGLDDRTESTRSIGGASRVTEEVDRENLWDWMYDVDYGLCFFRSEIESSRS